MTAGPGAPDEVRRHVPWLLRGAVWCRGFHTQVGWVLVGLGAALLWWTTPWSDLHDFRGPLETAQGRLTERLPTHIRQPGAALFVCRYTFVTDDGRAGAAWCYGESASVQSRDLTQEQRGRTRRRTQLEVRRARHRQRATSEECATEIGGAAARSSDDPSRRSLEGSVSPVDDAGGSEDMEGVSVACDVQLVPRRSVECASPVRPDLRADVDIPQQREGTANSSSAPEVEVQCPVSTGSEMQAAGRVEERGELGPPIAGATRRDSGQLLPYVFGCDHKRTPSSASNRRLTPTPVAP